MKIVRSTKMQSIEVRAIEEGASAKAFMERVGKEVADFLSREFPIGSIHFLIGKGNNGGDGYAAAICLLAEKREVIAYHFFPKEECSSLCQEERERFEKLGGKVIDAGRFELLSSEGVIVDALLGTGFKGKPSPLIEEVIRGANEMKWPVVSIDIPSGLNGDSGAVESVAIEAAVTLYLALPKMGFFLGKGWEYVGDLIRIDFGLEERFIEKEEVVATLAEEAYISSLLPPIHRTRHKYETGYLLTVAGSPGMMGAAAIATKGALRSGVGIVRLFTADLSEGVPLEVIGEGSLDSRRILEEAKRAQALLIGPGMGRSEKAGDLLKVLLESSSLPLLLDADALYFIGENPRWEIPKNSILTPHHGEMQRLLNKKVEGEELFTHSRAFAEEKGVTLVLKGAPTYVFHPGKLPQVIGRGDPGMATAGTGDLLSGVISAFLAQGLLPEDAALAGVFLHALAGEIGAAELTSYSLTASDLIDYLPAAFSILQVRESF